MTRFVAPIIAAGALATIFAGTASAQDATPRKPIIERQHRPEAIGLPGVHLDATSTTDRTTGPGGLRNGVGDSGTLAPSTTGSNDGLVNDTGGVIGIPL